MNLIPNEKKRARASYKGADKEKSFKPVHKKLPLIYTTLVDLPSDCMTRVFESFQCEIIEQEDWASISCLRLFMCGNKRLSALLGKSFTTFRHVLPTDQHYSTDESRLKGKAYKGPLLSALKKKCAFVPHVSKIHGSLSLPLCQFESIRAIEFFVDNQVFATPVGEPKNSVAERLGNIFSNLLYSVMQNPPPNLQSFCITTTVHYNQRTEHGGTRYLDPFLPDRHALICFLHRCPKLVSLNVSIDGRDYSPALGYDGLVNYSLRKQQIIENPTKPHLPRLEFVQVISNHNPNIPVLYYVMEAAMKSGSSFTSIIQPFTISDDMTTPEHCINEVVLSKFGQQCSRLLFTSNSGKGNATPCVTGEYLVLTPFLVYLDAPLIFYDCYLYDLPPTLKELKCNGFYFGGLVSSVATNSGTLYIPGQHADDGRKPNFPPGLVDLTIADCFSHHILIPPSCVRLNQHNTFDRVSRRLPRRGSHLDKTICWRETHHQHDENQSTGAEYWLHGSNDWNEFQSATSIHYRPLSMLTFLRLHMNELSGSIPSHQQELDLRALTSLEKAHLSIQYLCDGMAGKVDLGKMLPSSIKWFNAIVTVPYVIFSSKCSVTIDLAPLINLIELNLRYVCVDSESAVQFTSPMRGSKLQSAKIFLEHKPAILNGRKSVHKETCTYIQQKETSWHSKYVMRIDASILQSDDVQYVCKTNEQLIRTRQYTSAALLVVSGPAANNAEINFAV